MHIFSNLQEFKAFRKHRRTAVTIGNFDGCHLGHQALCRSLILRAKKSDALSLAITFDPHPASVLGHAKTILRLQRPAERLRSLETTGLEAAVIMPFTRDIAALTPEEFIKAYLVDLAGAEYVSVGENFRFGKGRTGDINMLSTLGHSYKIEVQALAPVLSHGEVVSSTLIRKCLMERGDLHRARELLGRPWSFSGEVIAGKKLGRQIGFPTANLNTEDLVTPRLGVYAGWVTLQNTIEKIPMVMNVGLRPTVEPSGQDKRVEVHLLDKKPHDLYGKIICVEPTLFLREERKFVNIEALTAQIRIDCEEALKHLTSNVP